MKNNKKASMLMAQLKTWHTYDVSDDKLLTTTIAIGMPQNL